MSARVLKSLGIASEYRDSQNPVRRDIMEWLEANRLRHVKVHLQRLCGLAELMTWTGDSALKELPDWRWDTIVKDDADFWDFAFVTGAVNYAFVHTNGDRYENAGLTGTDAMFAAVTRNIDDFRLPFEAHKTAESLGSVFGGIPLLSCRQRSLNCLSESFRRGGHSTVREMVTGHDSLFGSGGLMRHIDRLFPPYRDKTRGVRFWKRLQLFVAMLVGRGLANWPDEVGDMTVFADYRVPQALSATGGIELSSNLAYKIRNRIEIERNSRFELELRLASVVASDALVRILRHFGKPHVTCLHVDSYLWKLGRRLGAAAPPHVTVTTAY